MSFEVIDRSKAVTLQLLEELFFIKKYQSIQFMLNFVMSCYACCFAVLTVFVLSRCP